jgi:hypothetical protein
MSPGGNAADWQIGKSIRDWNAAETARQNAASAPIPATPFTPTMPSPAPIGGGWSGGTTWPGGGGGRAATGTYVPGRPAKAVLGFLFLLCSFKWYYITIPLWACMYPLSVAVGILTARAALAAFGNDPVLTGSGRLLIGGAIAVVATLLATHFERPVAARHKLFWLARHVLRLALFATFTYIVALRTPLVAGAPVFTRDLDPLRHPAQLAIAVAAAAALHFYLTRTTWGRDT